MSEMVERVAPATFAACNGPEGFGDHMDPRYEANSELFEAMARAAIEAMRQPTDAMLVAAIADSDEYGFGSYEAGSCWRAMIDAALADPA